MLLSKAIEGFIEHLVSKEKSRQTIIGYTAALRTFQKRQELLFNRPVYVEDIHLNDLEAYLKFRQEKGDVTISRNRILYIFRAFYDYLYKRDLVEKDISQNLEPIKVQQKERNYLSLEDVEHLLNGIHKPIYHAAISTLAYTGLRISELCNLTLSDVDLEKNLIKVRNGKGNKDRIIPISVKLKVILTEYLMRHRHSESDQFFATSSSGGMSRQSINNCLQETARKVGIQGPITAHVLRHSFASALVTNNAPLASIQSILGHSDLKVTSRYIHRDLEQLHSAVNLL